MDQRNTPLFTKLYKHQQTSPHSFHVPGHKNGQVFLDEARSTFQQILTIDQTEISGLDDLHDATGVIAEAQQLAAHLYGVYSTDFLVGGSTVGNMVMMMAVADRGDRVLVQRNSHQSVFHGLELAGLQPVFLEPEWDEETGLALGVMLDTLKQAVAKYPDAKALLLTHPTYEGYGQDLRDHVSVAHKAGMIVCVDEAHGPHLIFDDGNGMWPQSALRAGADLVVQSAHKLLPAMTMASFLHTNSKNINRDRLKNYLRMLQSSSPSYPLMASLDTARAYLAAMTNRDWVNLTEKITKFKQSLVSGPGWIQSPRMLGKYVQDPLKLTFVTSESGASNVWKKRLEHEGAFPELVSPHHLLLTLPLSSEAINERHWVPKLKKILHLNDRFHNQTIIGEKTMVEPVSELACPYEEMNQRIVERLDWDKTEGRVAAETITPYPPGIPLVLKGEKVRADHLDRLEQLIDEGASFQTGSSWINEGIKIFVGRGE